MNNSANKVGEIFREAGTAFIKLSEMTVTLHPMGDSQPGKEVAAVKVDGDHLPPRGQSAQIRGKWTDEEIDMLRSCVHRFATDLNKLSQHIKNRTVTQIRTTLKKKAFEDAGIPVRQVSSSGQNHSQPQPPQVTLNMLNAPENEVDVEGLGSEVKLEFEPSTEEVPA